MNPENEELFRQQVADYIEQNIEPLGLDDDDDFFELLLFFGLLGIRDAERQSVQQGGRELTNDERAELDGLMEAYVVTRTAQLSGLPIPIPPELTVNRIVDPALSQSLDTTAKATITGAVVAHIAEGKDKVREVLQKQIENRAELIASQESAKTMSAGMSMASEKLGAKSKVWLRTRSQNPRDIHLAQVGVVVPYDETFPDGSFWSNELVNCKCGIRLIYTE